MAAIIIDDALLIRSYTEADAASLFQAVHGSRPHLHPWLNWVAHTTREEHSLEFIRGALYDESAQQSLAYGIFHAGGVIGGIGMHDWKHDLKKAQLGYWLSKEHEGKGVLHRCLVQFISYLFDKTTITKLEIQFVPANLRSARVAERLGFRIEGIIRQGVVRNGALEDVVITGLLKSEWVKSEYNGGSAEKMKIYNNI